jgi:hypothetical protein
LKERFTKILENIGKYSWDKKITFIALFLLFEYMVATFTSSNNIVGITSIHALLITR